LSHTISTLCRGQTTIIQYEILQRADRLFKEKCGRYFGGVLSDLEVAKLIEGFEDKMR
jgi:hypothetical protein